MNYAPWMPLPATLRTALAWVAIGSAALCGTVVQDDTSQDTLQAPGAIECHAEWGPVKSSVYPLVRALAAADDTPDEVRALARALEERYSYPVDFQLIDTAGRLYAQAAANDHVPSYIAVVQKGVKAKDPLPAGERRAPPKRRVKIVPGKRVK